MGDQRVKQANNQTSVQRGHHEAQQAPATDEPIAPEITPDTVGQSGTLRRQHLLMLQNTRGNRHVQRVIGRVQRHAGHSHANEESDTPVQRTPDQSQIQRVPLTVSSSKTPTTLLQPYDKDNNPTQDYHPHVYGGGEATYDMERGGTAVTVDVKIKFVKRVNQGDAEQEIPEGTTRDFARNQCKELAKFWNNKFQLVGNRKEQNNSGGSPSSPQPGTTPTPANGVTPPAPNSGPPGEVKLDLTFSATPVFGLGETAHKTVALHDEVTADGSALTADQPTVDGQPRSRRIDAGNWFVQKNNAVYPASFDSIYAHEYGHLLGIPDEYSRTNPDMHAMFHNVSPQDEAAMNNTLDKAGIKQLILASIGPKLKASIVYLGSEVAEAMEAQQAVVAQHLAAGLRKGWRQQTLLNQIVTQLQAQFDAAGQTKASKAVSKAVRFEAMNNLSNISIAQNVVPGELSVAAIQKLLSSSMSSAVSAAQQGGRTVSIPYTNDAGAAASMSVRIDVAPAVGSSTTSPLSQAASDAAARITDDTPLPGKRKLPLYPSNTLVGQLTSLPGKWRSTAGLMSDQTSQMDEKILQAVTAMLGTTDMSTLVNDDVKALYQVLYQMVNNISVTVCQTTVRDFVTAQIRPVMDQQISDLMGMIDAEVDRHQTAQGTGTNASPAAPVDPQLAAAARKMEEEARKMLNPPNPSTTGGTPPASGTPTGQSIKFSVNSLMGSNSASNDVRSDQMERIAVSFNSKVPTLRHNDEDPFKARSKS